jgi:hypothetical protein
MMQLKNLAGVAVGLGLLAGCSKSSNSPQTADFEGDAVRAGVAMDGTARQLASYGDASLVRSGIALGSSSHLKGTLVEAVQWKAKLDSDFSSFTNSLSQLIINAERNTRAVK